MAHVYNLVRTPFSLSLLILPHLFSVESHPSHRSHPISSCPLFLSMPVILQSGTSLSHHITIPSHLYHRITIPSHLSSHISVMSHYSPITSHLTTPSLIPSHFISSSLPSHPISSHHLINHLTLLPSNTPNLVTKAL